MNIYEVCWKLGDRECWELVTWQDAQGAMDAIANAHHGCTIGSVQVLVMGGGGPDEFQIREEDGLYRVGILDRHGDFHRENSYLTSELALDRVRWLCAGVPE